MEYTLEVWKTMVIRKVVDKCDPRSFFNVIGRMVVSTKQ